MKYKIGQSFLGHMYSSKQPYKMTIVAIKYFDQVPDGYSVEFDYSPHFERENFTSRRSENDIDTDIEDGMFTPIKQVQVITVDDDLFEL